MKADKKGVKLMFVNGKRVYTWEEIELNTHSPGVTICVGGDWFDVIMRFDTEKSTDTYHLDVEEAEALIAALNKAIAFHKYKRFHADRAWKIYSEESDQNNE